MIDFETELRQRLDRAADGAPAGDDLLPLIERRIAAGDRRSVALKVAAVALVALGVAGAAVGLAARDRDPGETTIATDPDTPTSTTAPPPPSTVPATGWAPMAEAPIAPRNQFTTLDVGGEVLVWGGYDLESGDMLLDGAVYRTASDTWAPVAEAPLDFNGSAVAAWTGEEAVVVVRDVDSESETDGQGQAAAYRPATDTWRRLAVPPVGFAVSAVWSGSEVLVTNVGSGPDDGGVIAYDPETDSWSEGSAPPGPVPDGDAVWTGSEILVAGRDPGREGQDVESPTAGEMVVYAYDPAADTWRAVPWGLDGGARDEVQVVWTGDRLFVGGGYAVASASTTPLTDAALLDPATDTWTDVPAAPQPFEGNWRGPETWTGTEVLTLTTRDGITSTAQLFDPATGTWRLDESPSGLLTNPEAPWVRSGTRVVFPLADGGTGGVSYQP